VAAIGLHTSSAGRVERVSLPSNRADVRESTRGAPKGALVGPMVVESTEGWDGEEDKADDDSVT
jgi:hypothetical protein